MRLLLQYHAFINSMTFSIERETPLDMAFEADHQDAIAILISMDAMVGEDVKHLAAGKIQRAWRRYSDNLKEEKQNFLMLKQEHLRRDADEIRRIRIASTSKTSPVVEITEKKKLEQVVAAFLPAEAQLAPPNPIRVSIGTQTELKTKTHQTQTPRKLSSVKAEGLIFREEIPIDSEKLEKALRYNGESPEAFARNLFGTVPGARHHLLRQAKRRREYVRQSSQAAVVIQAWWRRKRHREYQSPADAKKESRVAGLNPWTSTTPKPSRGSIIANSDGVNERETPPKKRTLPALNEKTGINNSDNASGDSRASKSSKPSKETKKKKASKNRVFPSVTSDDIKKKSKPSKSLSSVSTRSSVDPNRRAIPQSITSKIYSSMWKK